MSQRTANARRAPRNPGAAIVSSSHLVSPRSRELSELEFGLIVAWNAFSRWAVRCMAAAGCPDLTITDVLLLHHVQHRARNKKLAGLPTSPGTRGKRVSNINTPRKPAGLR